MIKITFSNPFHRFRQSASSQETGQFIWERTKIPKCVILHCPKRGCEHQSAGWVQVFQLPPTLHSSFFFFLLLEVKKITQMWQPMMFLVPKLIETTHLERWFWELLWAPWDPPRMAKTPRPPIRGPGSIRTRRWGRTNSLSPTDVIKCPSLTTISLKTEQLLDQLWGFLPKRTDLYQKLCTYFCSFRIQINIYFYIHQS